MLSNGLSLWRAALGGHGGVIHLSAQVIDEFSPVGTAIGTLSVTGATGSPTFSISSDPDAVFALNGDGITLETAAAVDAATTHQVTIAVSGVSPSISSKAFTVTVTYVPSLDFSDPDNSQYLGVV